LGPVSFPSSYGEYADVRIAVFLNYAPDDELDKKGNPTLHFQRDVSGKFYNAPMKYLFDTMHTLMCLAGFDPYVAMLILLSSVVVMNMCTLMGPTKGWSDTEEYRYLSQFHKCENLVGVMVFGHKASENILPWLRDNYTKKLLLRVRFHFSILALYTELPFLAAPTAPRQSSPNRREMWTRQILALMRLSFC